MEWRALPWYVRALVVLAGVLLLSCGSIVAAGLRGLARAHGRLVRARQRLARTQRLEAKLDRAATAPWRLVSHFVSLVRF